MSDQVTPGKLVQRSQPDSNDRKEIVFWDEDSPRCVVNLLSAKLKERALEVPNHLLAMTDDQLEKAVEPTMIHENLRLAFWDEYFVASDNNLKMRVESIYPRVCSREYFYKSFVHDDLNLAYMMRPPVEYTLKMRSLLELGHRQMEKVMRMPLVDAKGRPDSRLIAEVVKIVALLDNRIKGAVTQKLQVETKSQVHNHNTYETPKKLGDIQDEMARIEREIKQLTKPQKLFDDKDVIEVKKDTDVGARGSK